MSNTITGTEIGVTIRGATPAYLAPGAELLSSYVYEGTLVAGPRSTFSGVVEINSQITAESNSFLDGVRVFGGVFQPVFFTSVYIESGATAKNVNEFKGDIQNQGYINGLTLSYSPYIEYVIDGSGGTINNATMLPPPGKISDGQAIGIEIDGGTLKNSSFVTGFNQFSGFGKNLDGINLTSGLSDNVTLAGGALENVSGTGVALNTVLETKGYLVDAGGHIGATTFAGSSGIVITNPSGSIGSIYGFSKGDFITFFSFSEQGTVTTNQDGVIDIDGVELRFNQSPGTELVLGLNTVRGGGSTELTLMGTIDVATCFTAGTFIRTPIGERPVESFHIGDTILTADGPKRIKFIGHSHYDGRFVGGNRKMLPVCIAAGAIAPGIPSRDLHVSPGHCLYIDGVLIQAGRLVNGVNITQAASVERLDYYHIELEHHGVIFAEDCATESFHAAEDLPPFHNEAEFAALYPEGRAPEPRCAELVESGHKLARIERRILSRSKNLIRGYVDAPRVLEQFTDAIGQARQRVELNAWAQYLPPALAAQPVALKIIAGGKQFRALANYEREDLRATGIGDGRHALKLVVTLPATARLDRIVVRAALNGQRLEFTDDARTVLATRPEAKPRRRAAAVLSA